MSKVLVTGGASFIGSHLVETLVKRGDEVWVVDDLSSGDLENLTGVWADLQFIEKDLRDPYDALAATPKGLDTVFHLAADHGGRGYVELRQVACAINFVLDQNVFRAALEREVPKIVFASSGCIYPMYKQTSAKEMLYLRESEAGPPYDPDGLYGLAKLSGELLLREITKEYGTKTASCRFFTVYGPRGKENHAVIAMIARAFIKQDPFEIWGDGTQVRNWTHVDDIVEGLLASEALLDAGAQDNLELNIGTTERTSVLQAAQMIVEAAQSHAGWAGYNPKFSFDTAKPTGPLNRVADNSRLLELTGHQMKPFYFGVAEVLEWYFATKDRDYVEEHLEELLIERKASLL